MEELKLKICYYLNCESLIHLGTLSKPNAKSEHNFGCVGSYKGWFTCFDSYGANPKRNRFIKNHHLLLMIRFCDWLCQVFSLTLFILCFFGWCSTVEGCFPPPPYDSFVFKVRRLKFCTTLLRGRINILGQEKSGSNR